MIEELIKNYGKNDQRTDEWHAKRASILTASEIYKVGKNGTPASRYEVMMSKLVPRIRGEIGTGPRALIWGTRFEKIANDIYFETIEAENIVETTCIPHPNSEYKLGASPDGIVIPTDPNIAPYLVEFKCPISRDFNQDTPIPPAYYDQMQLQMSCTGISKCEYVEFKFNELTYSEWLRSTAEYKSIFCVNEDGSVNYKCFYQTDYDEWLNQTVDGERVYWELEKFQVKKVESDPNWFAENLPYWKATWEEIEMHKQNNTFPDNPSKKSTLTLEL